MLDRPRRQAALTAMQNVRSVLEWESLPETSAKFQEIAAEFDRQFDEERQLTHTTDTLDADNSCDADETSGPSEDEAMDQDDIDFIDNAEDDYADSDETFKISDDEELSTSSEQSFDDNSVLMELNDTMPQSPTSSVLQFDVGSFLVDDSDAGQSS